MRYLTCLSILCLALSTAACGGGGGGEDDLRGRGAVIPQTDFIHYANVDNIFLTLSRIDHPLLDGNPNAVLLVTQNLNPAGALTRVPNRAVMGVQYIGAGAAGRWHLSNLDGSAMPPGASFNVSLFGARPQERNVIHAVTPANRLPTIFSFLSNAADAPSDLIAFLTQAPGARGAATVFNRTHTGLSRGGSNWAVLNQRGVSIPLGSTYFIGLTPAGADTWIHEATVGNTVGARTVLRHPRLDGNPNAIVQISRALAGDGSVLVDHPIAVQYDFLRSRWSITTQDATAIAAQTRFTVSVR